jgi:hypothetical protein
MMKLFEEGHDFKGCKEMWSDLVFLVPPQEGGVDYRK